MTISKHRRFGPRVAISLLSLPVGLSLAQVPTVEKQDVDLEVYSAPEMETFRPDPYPRGEMESAREGWVIVNFMVDPNGKPYEVGVVDSLGGLPFEKAAIRSIERSIFRPAKAGDKATDAGVVLKLKFSIRDLANGARAKFRAQYVRLAKAVNDGDQSAADAAIKGLTPENLYEAAYFNLGMYGYHRKWGTAAEQIEDLEEAIAGEDKPKYLSKLEFVAVLAALMKMEIDGNDLGAALDNWRRLEPLATDAQKSQWAPIIVDIRRILLLDAPLPLKASIAKAGSWSNVLFRRRFHIVVHNGSVSDIKLRCQKSYLLFKYEPAIEYSVRRRDGECRIELVGEPGTQFTLIQT